MPLVHNVNARVSNFVFLYPDVLLAQQL
jgi:hypothetical protein